MLSSFLPWGIFFLPVFVIQKNVLPCTVTQQQAIKLLRTQWQAIHPSINQQSINQSEFK